jgi:D-alanyl-D-alanine dipeptidase
MPLTALAAAAILAAAQAGPQPEHPIPAGFVYIESVIPSARLEIRYFSDDNFTGARVDGYKAPRCILTKQAAYALKKVQDELEPYGLSLKFYDCYRPRRAVDSFIRWAKDETDTKMKAVYYPEVDKSRLFKDGYISSKSGHTRGSTVDLTIVALKDGKELDMGSPFDLFGPISHCDSKLVPPVNLANRLLLRALMTKSGFIPYSKEWWHFTLAKDLFPTGISTSRWSDAKSV